MIDKRGHFTDDGFLLLAGRFKLLSEPVRLKILHTLQRQELSVSEIVIQVGGLQANVSKHLGLLLEAGLLNRRKEGLSAYYSVADETVFEVCNLIRKSLERRINNQRDAIENIE